MSLKFTLTHCKVVITNQVCNRHLPSNVPAESLCGIHIGQGLAGDSHLIGLGTLETRSQHRLGNEKLIPTRKKIERRQMPASQFPSVSIRYTSTVPRRGHPSKAPERASSSYKNLRKKRAPMTNENLHVSTSLTVVYALHSQNHDWTQKP